MRYQSHRLPRWAAAFFIVATIIAGAPSAVAEEPSQWRARGVLVVVNKLSMKVEDRADHTVAATEFDGLVFNEAGEPFLDKARYQVVAVNDAGVLRVGYNSFTDADGAKVFAKYTITQSEPPVHQGTLEFTGGTGKYEGITGSGTCRITYISDRVGWNEFSAEYTIPAKPVSAKPAIGTPQPKPTSAQPKPSGSGDPAKPPAAATDQPKAPAAEQPKAPTSGSEQPKPPATGAAGPKGPANGADQPKPPTGGSDEPKR